jgi:succinyl-CoA synthetase alpha subunit
MGIIVDKDTRLLVQGITGSEGSNHTKRSLDYGTNVVGGVTPGRGGQEVHGVPVFDTVRECVQATGANASVIFVPAPAAADAIFESADAGLGVIVCITEGIPVQDMMRVKRALRGSGITLIGPNCPGVLTTSARCRLGIMPTDVFSEGSVGVVSRSGTLVYEAVAQLTANGIGQSTCVGVGGDPIAGSRTVEMLRLFEADPETKAVVLIGEIGGSAEQEAAEFIHSGMSKPVVAFIAGATAPPGRRMGHAGAIIEGAAGTAAAKKDALARAGAVICDSPADIGITMQRVLQERGRL